jgi:hypothetical protein
MKNLVILIIILVFTVQLKAQTATTANANIYQYAILRSKKIFGDISLDLFVDGKRINLFTTLKLDTVKTLNEYQDYSYIRDYTCVLKGINYMDSQGYELVTSSMAPADGAPLLREYVFRKKITAK